MGMKFYGNFNAEYKLLSHIELLFHYFLMTNYLRVILTKIESKREAKITENALERSQIPMSRSLTNWVA